MFIIIIVIIIGSTAVGHPQLCFSNTLCHSSHLQDLLSVFQCHQPVDQWMFVLFIVNFFIMSIVYSQFYVASKILQSSPHNMKFILGNCHVVTSRKPYFSWRKNENWLNWKQQKQWRHLDPNLIFIKSIHLR